MKRILIIPNITWGGSPVYDDEFDTTETEKRKQNELEKLLNKSPSMKKHYLEKKNKLKESYQKSVKSIDIDEKY